MNRIYLDKTGSHLYWIKDILDDKKLGAITFSNNKPKYQIKSIYQHRNIETEAKLCWRSKSAWADYYKDYLYHYNTDLADTDNYNHPIFSEACRLQNSGKNMFGRSTRLHPVAYAAWLKMQDAANSDDVNLQIISAYRSLDYQKKLIDNKLAKGLTIAEILTVNTLPGYSEHHTGCAIDIGSIGEATLQENFDASAAFKWLQNQASGYGFTMSYPKDNTTGIGYEPWHWCYHPVKPI